ncbi:chloramphenicol phosphotransferase [Devosia sp.]|uniref:chloramphenicol phosphotransferase n=1 Tax=Devosia sp. TaxID=1871048 RepID=UPI0035B258D5
MRHCIIYLLGYQGVGKLTIARAIGQRTEAVLIDNHLTANPVFTAVANDQLGGIPSSVKDKIDRVRAAVFDAIVEDAPPGLSYILTDVLMDDDLGRRRYTTVLDLAARRRAPLVPVLLRCDDDEEYERRVTDPERAKLLKQTDRERSLERRATRPLLPVSHANLLALDVSRMSPVEAARVILDHVESLTA